MTDGLRKLPDKIQQSNFLPPWLWCWLLLYLGGFFHSYTYISTDLNILFASKDAILSGNIIELSLTIGELVPLLAIFAGILIVFFPWMRAWGLRLRYNIQTVEDAKRIPSLEATSTLLEVQAFIHSYAPEIHVTYAIGFADHTLDELRIRDQVPEQWLSLLLRKYWRKLANQFVTRLTDPITYTTNYFQTTITVNSGLLSDWENARQKAEEVLLHELAHHYHGDAAIVGAGSLLEMVSRCWIWFAIIFSIVPFVIFDTIYYITYAQGFELIDKILPNAQQALFLHILQNIGLYDMPALLLNLSLSLVWNATNFILLIAAIWCVELNADRFARDNAHSISMFENKQRKTGWQWIFANTNHPPFELRKWVARQEGIIGNNLLLLLFPFSFLVYLLLLFIQNFIYGLPLIYSKENIGDLLKQVSGGTIFYLRDILPVLLSIVAVLLLWPRCARIWEQIFQRNIGRSKYTATEATTRLPYKTYVVGAFLTLCILGALLLALSISTTKTFTISWPALLVAPTEAIPTIPTDNLPIPMLGQSYKGRLENAATHKQAQIAFSAIVQNQQGQVHGIITIAAPLLEKGRFSGTVMNDRVIRLTFTPNQKTANSIIQFTGTVQKDGTLVGFYTIPGAGEVGNWQAKQT